MENLRADTVTTWFHENVVCRFGVPLWVRTDRGSEFRAEFEAYCAVNNIVVRRTSAHNPRANGQTERYCGAVVSGVRRLMDWVPGAEWY